jgi:hypothetical protein
VKTLTDTKLGLQVFFVPARGRAEFLKSGEKSQQILGEKIIIDKPDVTFYKYKI